MSRANIFRQSIEQAQRSMASCEPLVPALDRAADVLIGALQRGRKILTCGNGGSAGDAQHIASELVNRFETERAALAAVSLVPDSSVVTAIANDYAYDVLFSRQVEALGREGDVLMAFSTSGNSRNVVRAIEAAQARGMTVIAITGKGGGHVAQRLRRFDVEVRAPATDTARIQEVHLLAIHALCKALDAHFTQPRLVAPAKVQEDWSELVALTRGLRPLVFTNGVFDILHRGHVTYLQRARDLGACLVVGVNSDQSVRLLGKGPERPLQTAQDRAHVLAALGCVDFVTIFNEATPETLIRKLQPDVLIKGADYAVSDIAGADFVLAHGGRVERVTFEHDRSTTAIVRKIQQSQEEPI
jgi:phosphoheptose isomerase